MSEVINIKPNWRFTVHVFCLHADQKKRSAHALGLLLIEFGKIGKEAQDLALEMLDEKLHYQVRAAAQEKLYKLADEADAHLRKQEKRQE